MLTCWWSGRWERAKVYSPNPNRQGRPTPDAPGGHSCAQSLLCRVHPRAPLTPRGEPVKGFDRAAIRICRLARRALHLPSLPSFPLSVSLLGGARGGAKGLWQGKPASAIPRSLSRSPFLSLPCPLPLGRIRWGEMGWGGFASAIGWCALLSLASCSLVLSLSGWGELGRNLCRSIRSLSP